MATNKFIGAFNKLFRRSFDQQTWINDWLKGKDIGSSTYSGITINQENAIKYSAVLACGRIISETIASLPLFVYRRLNDGKVKAVEHPLYDLLHTKPNNEMTSFIFREIMMWHLLFWGNFYAEIQEDNSGNIIGLFPLLPWKMTVIRNNGKLVYKYLLPDNTEKIIPNDYILHIPGLSWDGLYGKSLISLSKEAIGLGMALEEFGAKYFGQGTQFGGFIEHPKQLGDKAFEHLSSSLKEKYKGISNAHKIFILEEGMKFNKNIIPPDDSQFIESRKFQTIEICRIFNVPPHLIKDLERATYSNIEHQGIEFVTYTIRPWLTRIEQSISVKLFTDVERIQYFAEFLVDGLYRGDIQTRYNAYAIGKQWGWLSSDDIRSLENMNPLPDGQGSIYWMPLNMIDASQAGQVDSFLKTNQQASIDVKPIEVKAIESRATRSANLKSRIAKSYRGLFQEASERIIKLERNDILKATESIFGKRNFKLLNFMEFLNEYYTKKYDEIDKRMKPVINTYGKVISDTVSEEIESVVNNSNIDKFLDSYSESFNNRYVAISKLKLSDTVQKAVDENLDIYGEVEKTFNDWELSRASSIANRETIQLAGAVSYFVYKDAGIQRIMWVNTGSKSCPFCSQLNGQVMGIDQPYKSSGDIMEAEGVEPLRFSSNIFHPPAHGGCQCQLTFA